MAKMADDLKIPVFDGKEYECWKKRILMLLKFKTCENPATREMATTDDETQWSKMNLKAMNYIYSGITNDQLQFVKDEDTAFKIMKKFDEMYLKESTALQICVRNKLEKVKLKDFEDSSVFFTEFEKLINDLKSAGANVTEQEKLNYMLKMLPTSLSYIGDLIDVLPKPEQTVEYLKSKIKMFELKEKEEGNKNSASVFKSERKKESACFKCGKVGHFKAQCVSVKQSEGAWKPRGGRQQQRMQYRGSSCRGGAGRNYTQGRQGSGWQQQQQWRQGQDQRNENSGNNQNSFCIEVEKKFEENFTESLNIEVNNNNVNSVEWLLDSGCSDHIINNDACYNECTDLKVPVNVKVGDGRILKATKVGNIFVMFNDLNQEVELLNVFFVKEMDRNLISYGKVTNSNKVISKGDTSKVYNKFGDLIAIAYKKNDIYFLNSFIVRKESNLVNKEIHVNEITEKEKLHRKLGHVNFSYLRTMCNKKLLEGLPNEIESDYFKCKICIENKMHNLPFEDNRKRGKQILEIIHTDLNGPHSIIGLNGEKYFLTFIDDYSKVVKVFVIKSKNEVFNCFMDYVNTTENMTGKKIKILRCDNGTEYLNKDVYRFAREKGIFIEPCPPYVHELNGTAENYNRNIMNMSRCLLAEANLEKRYWPEIVKTAAYLKNRIISNSVEKNKTPYEIMFGEKPCIKNLRLYGSKVFVRIPEQKRKTKWDHKAEMGILVGYEKVGYRVLLKGKIVVVRHVDIVEEDVKMVCFEDKENEIEDIDLNENENINDQNLNLGLRRSTREINKPARFNDENFRL